MAIWEMWCGECGVGIGAVRRLWRCGGGGGERGGVVHGERQCEECGDEGSVVWGMRQCGVWR